jgi:hypothetical protein
MALKRDQGAGIRGQRPDAGREQRHYHYPLPTVDAARPFATLLLSRLSSRTG